MSDKVEAPPEMKEAFAELISAQEELTVLEEWLEESHPHEMLRFRELRKEIPALMGKVTDTVRAHGQSVEYLGHKFKVVNWAKDYVDTIELVHKAKERGDVGTLMEFGLLEYKVATKQIERLPGDLKTVYSQFIEKKAQTPRVSIPKELKGL